MSPESQAARIAPVVSVGAALAALLLTSFHALRQEIADLRGEFAEMRGEPREPTQTNGARGRVAGGAPRGQLRTGGRPTSASPRLSFVVVLLALAAPLPLDGQIPPEVRQAAEQGDASAQFNLGFRYDTGEGVPEDDAEAVRWWLQAAEQGYASAQFNLGFMYANGEGVLKDATLAHMWYNIAGANGSEIAREWRDTIEDDMTATQIARATELARTCMDSDYENCEG